MACLLALLDSSRADDATGKSVGSTVTASTMLSEQITSACIDCHSGSDAEARLDLEKMLGEPLAWNLSDWRKAARLLQDGSMPPQEASELSDPMRSEIASELRVLITHAAKQHAHDPGPSVVRRLTSAEFDYCLEDLTGLQLGLGDQFVSDSVGGSGFTNSAAAQFMQDAMLERYLEAAKKVADHTKIGAGPLHFHEATGQTGMELSAIERIQRLYHQYGFRAAAGEGARPYGLDRFPKALEVAWKYRHREAIGNSARSLDQLAIDAELDPKFVRHLWDALNQSNPSFPLSEVIASWNRLPIPIAGDRIPNGGQGDASIAELCGELFQQVQRWQERFAGAASAEEEAAVLTGGNIIIPSSRDFLVRARRKRIELDDNFTPDLNDPRLYSSDGTVRLRITVEAASEPRDPEPSVIVAKPTFQFRYLDQVDPDPVSLQSIVVPRCADELEFGKNIGGEKIEPDEFVVRVGEEKFVVVILPEGCNLGQLCFQARLDPVRGRDCVIRCVIEDITDSGGAAGGRYYSSLLRDQSSREMARWEAGLSEFARTFPQISHREPTPSDRDPIPAPYDNTYNLPERNHFHTAVKYHRDDAFLTEYLMTPSARKVLDEAWADLLLSFDYHDVNLRFTAEKYGIELPIAKIASADSKWIDSLPDEPRSFISRYKTEYDSMQSLMRSAETDHLDELCRFAAKAWRRPLHESEDRELRSFYHSLRQADQLSQREAVRATIARVLVSPDFLFRAEQSPAERSDQLLSGFELASRLSFSLWSSLPDDQLRSLAEQDTLQDDAVLEQQVTRMLASPKARRMAIEFLGQWLGFYQFDRFRGVDQARFPEFDEDLRGSLYQEAIAFCEYIIREDRPYHELIDADYVFVDSRLADHYGMTWTDESSTGRQRITLDADQPRGGLLGLGAVLISTSAPLRTSPVKRGDWILRRLLGTPVPPPPADAGSIPADDTLGDGKTVRQRLELHRNQAACRGCHVRIDPLGFALEHFDSLGRWRETYRDGQPIDDAGILKSGHRLEGIRGLIAQLRDRDEDFRRTFASKLTAYVLGRPETISDTALIQAISDQLATDPRYSAAVRTIVLSPQFRRIRGSATPGNKSNPKQRGPVAANSLGVEP